MSAYIYMITNDFHSLVAICGKAILRRFVTG